MQINGSMKKDNWVDQAGNKQFVAVVVCTTCWMIRHDSIPKEIGAPPALCVTVASPTPLI